MGSLWFTKFDFLELPGPACISEPFSYVDMLLIKTVGPIVLAVVLAIPWLFVTLARWGNPAHTKKENGEDKRLKDADPDDVKWKENLEEHLNTLTAKDEPEETAAILVDMGWTWYQALDVANKTGETRELDIKKAREKLHEKCP
eukprot:1776173-Rhodomonas_salina.1